jgi:hypothetical protein
VQTDIRRHALNDDGLLDKNFGIGSLFPTGCSELWRTDLLA